MKTFNKVSTLLGMGLLAITSMASTAVTCAPTHGKSVISLEKLVKTPALLKKLNNANPAEEVFGIQSAGAWSDTVWSSPTMYYGNQWYAGQKLLPPTAPFGNKINSVHYEFTTNNYSSLNAYLCILNSVGSTDGCLPLSYSAARTDAFDDYNPQYGLKFYFLVNNGGAYISPNRVITESQVIVNYE